MRISAISYLNTAPLMWDFEHGIAPAGFEVSYTIPSQCAAELQAGNAEIGIIPSAAYATIADLAILPGVAIAAKRAVRSILLVSKKPLGQITSVALDNSSLTSVALTRVLFELHWKRSPRFTSASPDLTGMLTENDAALLIGDPALKVDRSQYMTWDLAEEWIRFTGKPFVFAFWAARRESARMTNVDLTTIFQRSCAHGLQPENVDTIADVWSRKLKLPSEELRRYLTENIHYQLDRECMDGLNEFYRMAYDCGILPRIPTLEFLPSKPVLIA